MEFSKERAEKHVLSNEKKVFNFLNLHSLYLFNRVDEFRESVSFESCLNFADGNVIAKKLRIARQRGPSFTKNFLKTDVAKKKKHFFVGLGEDERKKLSEKTGIDVKKIGAHNPSFISGIKFSEKEKKEMRDKINSFGADYLWICVGNPKQEILAYQIFEEVNVNNIFNVGAAIDFILGRQKEAPLFWQNAGLEWFYLGFTNPKRTLKKIKMSLIALKYLGRVRVR